MRNLKSLIPANSDFDLASAAPINDNGHIAPNPKRFQKTKNLEKTSHTHSEFIGNSSASASLNGRRTFYRVVGRSG